MGSLLVTDLGKDFPSGSVLDGVSFTLEAGASLAVIGPSGCGKSTMLSLLSGLTKASRGSVELPETCRTAFILQDYGLFPWKTVYDNLVLPPSSPALTSCSWTNLSPRWTPSPASGFRNCFWLSGNAVPCPSSS